MYKDFRLYDTPGPKSENAVSLAYVLKVQELAFVPLPSLVDPMHLYYFVP